MHLRSPGYGPGGMLLPHAATAHPRGLEPRSRSPEPRVLPLGLWVHGLPTRIRTSNCGSVDHRDVHFTMGRDCRSGWRESNPHSPLTVAGVETRTGTAASKQDRGAGRNRTDDEPLCRRPPFHLATAPWTRRRESNPLGPAWKAGVKPYDLSGIELPLGLEPSISRVPGGCLAI